MKLHPAAHHVARAEAARAKSARADRLDAFLDAFLRDHATNPEKLRQLGPGLRAFVDEWGQKKDRSHGRP